jgi:hypothetical protein
MLVYISIVFYDYDCSWGPPVSEYRLPFEEHVGQQQPTLEEMMEAAEATTTTLL